MEGRDTLEAGVCEVPRTDLSGRPWQERWKGRNLVRGRRARVCHSTLLPAVVLTQVNQAMLLTKQQIPNTVVPCYPKGVSSKTPNGCLKPWIALKHIYTMLFPIHAYLR